jgi:hypothetical protein
VAARPCLNLSSAELLVRIRAEYLEAAGIHTREGRRARASPNRPWTKSEIRPQRMGRTHLLPRPENEIPER